jgi:hypothetical protein
VVTAVVALGVGVTVFRRYEDALIFNL